MSTIKTERISHEKYRYWTFIRWILLLHLSTAFANGIPTDSSQNATDFPESKDGDTNCLPNDNVTDWFQSGIFSVYEELPLDCPDTASTNLTSSERASGTLDARNGTSNMRNSTLDAPNWTLTTQDGTLNAPDVLVGSEWERILTAMVVMAMTLVSLLGQLVVMVTIYCCESLHTVEFYVLFANSIADVVAMLISGPSFLAQLLSDEETLLSAGWLASCRASSTIGIGTVFASTWMTGLIGYERYVYFCRPLAYTHHLQPGRVVAAMVTIYSIALTYTITTEILIGREYHVSTMMCELPARSRMTAVNLSVFRLPPVVITAYSCVRIWLLIRSNRVAPAVPAGFKLAVTTPIRKAVIALRMVLMATGALWGTYLPCNLFKVVIFSSGITWQALDSRTIMWATILTRLSSVIVSLMPPLLNPFIYLYSRRILREAALKLVGVRKRNRVWPSSTGAYSL